MPLFFSLQVESGQRCNFGGPAFVHGVLPRLRRVGGRAEAAAHRHRRLPRHRTGQTPSRTGAGHRAAHTLGIYHPISIALAPTSTCGFATLHLQKGHTTHYTLSKHTVIYFFLVQGATKDTGCTKVAPGDATLAPKLLEALSVRQESCV